MAAPKSRMSIGGWRLASRQADKTVQAPFRYYFVII
jgi:hypothetical protein